MKAGIFLTGLLLSCLFTYGQNKILVAAASDLRFAMDSIILVFNQSNSGKVEVTYGSSGKLTEQIIQGAPFDMLFSADLSYPEQLKKENKTGSELYQYAKGRIVIWSKKLDPQQQQMKSLTNTSIKKISIANPEHAPYGKRAMESLTYYKLLDNIKPKLVYGENISQASQFITSGAADIGIIALSLAVSPNMKKENGHYYIIPEESHSPLLQGAVITLHGKDNKLANSFFKFVQTDKAKGILKYFGLSKS